MKNKLLKSLFVAAIALVAVVSSRAEASFQFSLAAGNSSVSISSSENEAVVCRAPHRLAYHPHRHFHPRPHGPRPGFHPRPYGPRPGFHHRPHAPRPHFHHGRRPHGFRH